MGIGRLGGWRGERRDCGGMDEVSSPRVWYICVIEQSTSTESQWKIKDADVCCCPTSKRSNNNIRLKVRASTIVRKLFSGLGLVRREGRAQVTPAQMIKTSLDLNNAWLFPLIHVTLQHQSTPGLHAYSIVLCISILRKASATSQILTSNAESSGTAQSREIDYDPSQALTIYLLEHHVLHLRYGG